MDETSRSSQTGEDGKPPADDASSPEPNGSVAPTQAPPDGGMEAWIQVIGSWMMVFNTGGNMVIFGDYQTFYETGALFTQTSSNISWIGSIQTFAVFAVGAIVGPVYDRGYLRLLLAVGTFGTVFGHMMLSLCTQYWQVLLAQGFVIGIAGGCIFVPALAVVQPYFKKRLGLAVGIVATGSSGGSIIYPVVFTNLINRLGFAWTVRVLGFLSLVTLAVPLTLSRMRVQPARVRKIMDLSSLTDPTFVTCVFACFLGYASNFMAFFYLSFFSQASGLLSPNLALYLVPILASTSAFGRVLPNWLADHIGAVNVMIPGSLLTAVVLLCNLAVHNTAGIILTALAFGFLSGIFIATPPLLFMLLTEDKSKLGNRMGLAYAIIGSSVFPGGPGAGAVLQHDPTRLDWSAAWTYAAGLQVAACLTFCWLRVMKTGWTVKAKT